MRHKLNIRKFNRSPKHRKAMLRNLVTNLMKHERIETTLAKAKEMRSWVERVMHKAKANNYQGNIHLKRIIFTNPEIVKAKEIAKRFESLPAGFTRITYLGLRKNDRAEMCHIEMIGNPMEIYEKNEFEQKKESLGLQSYWDWEHKLLKQEQQYFQQNIDDLNIKIEREIDENLTMLAASPENQQLSTQMRKDIEKKYEQKRKFLEASLKRAQFEEGIHIKQQYYKRYDRLFKNYAFPQDLDVRNLIKS